MRTQVMNGTRTVARKFSSAFTRHREATGEKIRKAPETGASTAEYAMTMLVACAFAGVLMAIIKSSPIKTLLLGVIKKALSIG